MINEKDDKRIGGRRLINEKYFGKKTGKENHEKKKRKLKKRKGKESNKNIQVGSGKSGRGEWNKKTERRGGEIFACIVLENKNNIEKMKNVLFIIRSTEYTDRTGDVYKYRLHRQNRSCLEVQITQIVQEMFRSTESPDRAEEIS